MFCDVELAARIERAESQLVVDACANVARRVADVSVVPIGGGVAALTESGSPLNKVVGLGFGTFDAEEFAEIESVHVGRGAPVVVELATLADPAIANHLTRRGYELVGVENVLGRQLPIDERDPGGIDVRRSVPAEFETWAELIVTGFATPDVQGVPTHEEYERALLDRVMRDFAGAQGVVRYLAMIAGERVGAGTMRMFEGVAQLCGAATLPAHRRRGVQSSLLESRLIDAGREGCTIAVMTTQPGSKSQQNAHRQGFELLYSRNILRRPGPADG